MPEIDWSDPSTLEAAGLTANLTPLQKRQRQQSAALASALGTVKADNSPIYSPIAGFARVAQGVLEGLVERQERERQQGLIDQGNKALVDVLRSRGSGLLPGGSWVGSEGGGASGSSSGATASAAPFKTDDPIAQDLAPHQRAFLNAVAGGESGGKYNIRFTPRGGALFDNLSQHPNIAEMGPAGPSTAAGRYQFTKTTWDRMGGGDFSPENQDRRAWQLAQQDYGTRTGRSLDDDLKSGGLTPDVTKALAPTWSAFGGNTGRHIATYNDSLSRYANAEQPASTQTAAAPKSDNRPAYAYPVGDEPGAYNPEKADAADLPAPGARETGLSIGSGDDRPELGFFIPPGPTAPAPSTPDTSASQPAGDVPSIADAIANAVSTVGGGDDGSSAPSPLPADTGLPTIGDPITAAVGPVAAPGPLGADLAPAGPPSIRDAIRKATAKVDGSVAPAMAPLFSPQPLQAQSVPLTDVVPNIATPQKTVTPSVSSDPLAGQPWVDAVPGAAAATATGSDVGQPWVAPASPLLASPFTSPNNDLPVPAAPGVLAGMPSPPTDPGLPAPALPGPLGPIPSAPAISQYPMLDADNGTDPLASASSFTPAAQRTLTKPVTLGDATGLTADTPAVGRFTPDAPAPPLPPSRPQALAALLSPPVPPPRPDFADQPAPGAREAVGPAPDLTRAQRIAQMIAPDANNSPDGGAGAFSRSGMGGNDALVRALRGDPAPAAAPAPAAPQTAASAPARWPAPVSDATRRAAQQALAEHPEATPEQRNWARERVGSGSAASPSSGSGDVAATGSTTPVTARAGVPGAPTTAPIATAQSGPTVEQMAKISTLSNSPSAIHQEMAKTLLKEAMTSKSAPQHFMGGIAQRSSDGTVSWVLQPSEFRADWTASPNDPTVFFNKKDPRQWIRTDMPNPKTEDLTPALIPDGQGGFKPNANAVQRAPDGTVKAPFASGQTINVDTRAETAEAQAVGTGKGKLLTQAMELGTGARDKMKVLDTMGAALDAAGPNITTGLLGEPILRAKETLGGVLGTTFPGTAATEVFNNMGPQLAGATAKGFTNRFTQSEFQTFLRSKPGLINSPDGNRNMLTILRDQAQHEADLGDLAAGSKDYGEFRTKRDKYEAENPYINPWTGKPFATLGTPKPSEDSGAPAAPPSLMRPGESKSVGGVTIRRVN